MRFVNTPIPCKNCQKIFTPKCAKNVFCCRKCFKQDFHKRVKKNDNKFPAFICPNCKTRTILDFDPTQKGSKWLKFTCPNCNVLTINICEYITTQDGLV